MGKDYYQKLPLGQRVRAKPATSQSNIGKTRHRVNGLDEKQLKQFRELGYVMVPDVFDPDDLQPMRDELTEVIHEGALELLAAGKISSLYEDEPFERRLTRIHAESPAIMQALMGNGGGGHSGRALFAFVTHEKLLARIESLVGPEIVGSSVYRIRAKIPGWDRGAVPWHQDSGYFNPFCDDELIVTCWIPLVDTNAANGCLQVLPYTHAQGVVDHYSGGPGGYLAIKEEYLPAGEAVTVPVPVGGVLFMTNCTPHKSTQHHVDVVRWAIDVRYQSAKLPNNVGEVPERFDATLPLSEMACYPPEADFVVKSDENPESVVSSWEEFDAIRSRYEDVRPSFPGRGWVSRDGGVKPGFD